MCPATLFAGAPTGVAGVAGFAEVYRLAHARAVEHVSRRFHARYAVASAN